MTRKYYVNNMFWGYFMAVCVFYFSFGDHETKMIYLQIISALSAILFPFARYLIQKIAFKYTEKNFWETGVFRDGVPKTYLLTMYNILCFFISIPLGIACLFLEMKNSCYNK